MSSLRCLVCGKSFDPDQTPAMPFCSHRCRLIDLKRWLDEEHRVPVEPGLQAEDSDDGAPEPPA